MWGGWYHNSDIMAELKRMKETAEAAADKPQSDYPRARVVLFIDERAYINNPRGTRLADSVNSIRVAVGNSGIPFDLCMVEDAERLIKNYSAAVFTAPIPSESGKNALKLCESLGIPYIAASADKPSYTTEEIRDFLIACGVHCYNADGNVIYCGEGFLALHTVKSGEVSIKLPQKYKVKPIFGADICECETDKLTFYMDKHGTAVFELV